MTGDSHRDIERSSDAGTDDGTGDVDDGVPGAPPARRPGETPLLLDVMLGKLATYLRMCGYDAAYAGNRDAETDDAAVALAETEGRVLVTRDRELAARADPAVLLSSRDVVEQLRELVDAGFELALTDTPEFCSACNGRLERVDRTEPTPDYAPATYEATVWRCRECGQHFWKGSHWDDVRETLADL